MTFEEATTKALSFRDERNWDQFHNPKDLAISINLEASELLEAFQWSGADLTVSDKKSLMIEEIADIVIYCIYLSDKLDINIADAVDDKIASNELKYPAELSRDNSKKYTELQS